MTARVVRKRMAGRDHAVVTVVGGRPGAVRREPCDTCPWRIDAVGEFPAEAFRHSAPCAYDMATTTFACHASGQRKPAMCAGFLLRSSHNLAVRLKLHNGTISLRNVRDGGHALHKDYRAMAIANGVAPDDPVLAPCRDEE